MHVLAYSMHAWLCLVASCKLHIIMKLIEKRKKDLTEKFCAWCGQSLALIIWLRVC